ncbi:hypothetical protein VDQ94_11060 [Xanthomonas campestris pv. campestris]|nr:hypothetical protein [Xanthomonas campestris pv. campestris]MEB1555023.1 hypothetical protein [Xanthomonas campestris pv. campestris]
MTSKLFAWMKIGTFFAVMGLLVLGLFADFVPVQFLQGRTLKWPCLAVGIVLTVWLRRHNRRLGRPTDLDGHGRIFSVFMFFATPVMLGFVSWLLLAKTAPWLLTWAIGGSFEEAYVMQTDHQSSRSTCEYRLRGGPMEHGFPDYLCIHEDLYHRYPQQQVAVILKGQRSRFGTHIVEIYGPQ